MKKIVTFLIAFMLTFTTSIHAATEGKVTALEVKGTTEKVTISGTTDNILAAVVVQILDKENVILSMDTLTVTDNKFNGEIDDLTLENGATYSVRVADYDGGSWKSTTFVAEKEVSDDTTPPKVVTLGTIDVLYPDMEDTYAFILNEDVKIDNAQAYIEGSKEEVKIELYDSKTIQLTYTTPSTYNTITTIIVEGITDLAGNELEKTSFVVSRTISYSIPVNNGGGGSIPSYTVDTETTYTTLPISAIKSQITKGEDTTVNLSGAASVGKDIFETLAGRDTTLTLTTMSGNKEVVSFTFDSKNLVEAKEFNTGLTFTSNFDTTIKEQVKGDVKVLNFAYSGTLPGKATVTVDVSDTFADGKVLTLSTYNETTGKLEVVAKDIVVTNGKASFDLDHCSVWTLTETVEEPKTLDLSAYSDFGLNVYENSRVTSIKATTKGFDVAGYMWIDGVNTSKNTWREIIFVNAEDASTSKAYRKLVTAVYNPWLNKNMVASKNGTVKLDYANYTVNVDSTNMQNYAKTSTGAMTSGTYLVYMRISDGKNSYLFPLVDRPLSDGSTMESDETLPAGFSINDQETRTLVYTVK